MFCYWLKMIMPEIYLKRDDYKKGVDFRQQKLCIIIISGINRFESEQNTIGAG